MVAEVNTIKCQHTEVVEKHVPENKVSVSNCHCLRPNIAMQWCRQVLIPQGDMAGQGPGPQEKQDTLVRVKVSQGEKAGQGPGLQRKQVALVAVRNWVSELWRPALGDVCMMGSCTGQLWVHKQMTMQRSGPTPTVLTQAGAGKTAP